MPGKGRSERRKSCAWRDSRGQKFTFWEECDLDEKHSSIQILLYQLKSLLSKPQEHIQAWHSRLRIHLPKEDTQDRNQNRTTSQCSRSAVAPSEGPKLLLFCFQSISASNLGSFPLEEAFSVLQSLPKKAIEVLRSLEHAA